ncbi:hypothetical protein F5Y19DRAFT_53855 [Xylariaceae sp. FL1651]|nr:hypothetical protein F5Y19DRAFT_53855 [Xylariaceae sp. FL1651]
MQLSPQSTDLGNLNEFNMQLLLATLDQGPTGADFPNQITEEGAWAVPVSHCSGLSGFSAVATDTQKPAVLHADDHHISITDSIWPDSEWQGYLAGATDTSLTRSASASSPPFAALEARGGESTCACLKHLTDHLCHLNALERQKKPIHVDTALCKTDVTLTFAASVLECHLCRLDSKVLLLVTTVLQTVLNWIRIEYHQQQRQSQLPKPYPNSSRLPLVQVGSWKVPEADGNLIRSVLTSRVLASSSFVVNVLCLRVDEIALTSNDVQGLSYQSMDVEPLQQTLQRLTVSLRELTQYVKTSCMKGIPFP